MWLREPDLKIQTEALLFAAEEHALRANYVKVAQTSSNNLEEMCY